MVVALRGFEIERVGATDIIGVEVLLDGNRYAQPHVGVGPATTNRAVVLDEVERIAKLYDVPVLPICGYKALPHRVERIG